MESRQIFVQGSVAGILAYASVAIFLAVVNVFAGHSPFETAFLMGEALGAGAPGPGEAAGIVLAANGVHLLVSLLSGVAVAWVIAEVERHHALWYIAFMAVFTGFLAALLAGGILGVEFFSVTTWGRVAGATTLGAAALVGYLLWTHRSLYREIGTELES